MPKSAVEKLRTPAEPRIVKELPLRVQHWGPPGASMAISTPLEIEELVAKIPKGKLATVNTLRKAIARRHKTTITCPVTTGIFLNIVAKAAAEREMMGMTRITPWWRVLKSDGSLNEKMPGGLAAHRKRLAGEGFQVVPKGKTGLAVQDYESKLARLNEAAPAARRKTAVRTR
jgi:6-O-methylguanine DNA methyltransferase, DNA binding domain